MKLDDREKILWGWTPRNASMYAIAKAAEAAGLKHGRSRKIKSKQLLVTDGTRVVLFGRGACSLSSKRKLRVSKSKSRTRRYLEKRGCNTVQGKRFAVSEIPEAVSYAQWLGYPVIIKPDDGSKGKGVEKVYGEEDIIRYIRHVETIQDSIVVEKFFEASEYRFISVKGHILGVVNRVPANVTGDGNSTIRHLVEAKNEIRSNRRACPPIVIDDVVEGVLGRQGLSLESIVEKNRVVYLRDNSNVSLGGESVDVTDALHPGYLQALAKAGQAFSDIVMVGFDVFIKDVHEPPNATNWAVLEVNGSPMISLHHFPWEGKERDIAGYMLKEVFQLAG